MRRTKGAAGWVRSEGWLGAEPSSGRPWGPGQSRGLLQAEHVRIQLSRFAISYSICAVRLTGTAAGCTAGRRQWTGSRCGPGGSGASRRWPPAVEGQEREGEPARVGTSQMLRAAGCLEVAAWRQRSSATGRSRNPHAVAAGGSHQALAAAPCLQDICCHVQAVPQAEPATPAVGRQGAILQQLRQGQRRGTWYAAGRGSWAGSHHQC